MNKSYFLSALLLTLPAIPFVAFAHCAGNHTGNHPHCSSGEPPECTDVFPGFLYSVEPKRRNDPGEIRLASSDACRSELVAVDSDDSRGAGALHMTADRSEGLFMLTEDPGNGAQYVVYRQDFSVNANGDLILVQPVKILPLDGEEVSAGDQLYFFSMDIWGDETHDSLYMAVGRFHVFGPDPGDVFEELLIYNLNDMTDVREIYRSAQAAGEWTCPDVEYPQFVPTCYRPQGVRFNPSGTRLYIQDNIEDTQDQRWDAALRIHIDRIDGGTGSELPLADWNFSTPELVYTGWPGSNFGGTLARPDRLDPTILPSQEFIAIRYSDIGALLDADQCASDYAPYADGSVLLDSNFWQACLDPETITILSSYLHEGGDSWQSPDALLFSRLENRHYDIYRRYITGPLAGTEELLIEKAAGADTGY